MTISYKNNDLQMGQTPVMLLKNAIAANWILLVTCGSLLVVAAIIGTHRIAGPLFRFEKTLDSMRQKVLDDTIHLREKDEGKELAAKINAFNTLLSTDLKSIRRHSRAITDLLNRYNSFDPAKTAIDDIDSICKAIKNHNDKIKRLLESYQLVDE
jgi:methyl-accepting chemotaxis protein